MKNQLFSYKVSNTRFKSLGVSLTTYYLGDKLAYKMYVGGKLLFKGVDFKPSPLQGFETLDTNLCLLGFLTVGINDTDQEYFKDYTANQLAWAKGYDIRENLTCYISDLEDTESEYHAEALKSVKHKVF